MQKKSSKRTITHKGWLGFAPVLIANPEADVPTIFPRHKYFNPLLNASLFTFQSLFFLASLIAPDYEPGWPIRITGKVEPREVSVVSD